MKKVSNYSIRTAIGLIVTAVLILNLGQGITKGIQITEKKEINLSLSSLIPHDPIYINSDGNFTDYGFLGSGTVEDPYIIEGYNIITNDLHGIYITDTTKYFIVRNCYIDAEEYGIYIDDVADGTITVINNTCSNNYHFGIYLYSSYYSIVANNTCINNGKGIYPDSSLYSTVANNTCNYNGRGIWLRYSGRSTIVNNTCNNNKYYWGITLTDSSSSTVANNTCNNNRNCGITLLHSGSSTVANNTCINNGYSGIILTDSSSSTVTNNLCNNNGYRGILLEGSDFCVVTYNLLKENRYYGVNLRDDTDNNLIHHNTFVDNNLGGGSQGYDDGTNNVWYDSATQEGNYWSDWSGTGTYAIDGSAGAVDLYPLGVPVIIEYPQIVLLTLILSIVTLFLTRTISKKVKK